MARLAFLSLLLLTEALSAGTPLLKSSVRIIEGVAAPDWELRFLAEGPREALVPDADAPAREGSSAKEAPAKPQETPLSPPRAAGKKRPVVKEGTATAPKQGEPPAASPAPVGAPERESFAPGAAEQQRQPGPRAAKAAPTAPKIDKEDETGDDNAEKRKKERRDLLREERKEREYRNRRIE